MSKANPEVHEKPVRRRFDAACKFGQSDYARCSGTLTGFWPTRRVGGRNRHFNASVRHGMHLASRRFLRWCCCHEPASRKAPARTGHALLGHLGDLRW